MLYSSLAAPVNDGEIYTTNGNVFEVSEDSVFRGVWDALAIYGQYRAIDAQYENPPPPQNNTPQLKNDDGNYYGGEAFNNLSVNKMVLGGSILLLILAATAYVAQK